MSDVEWRPRDRLERETHVDGWFERDVNPLIFLAFGLACALGMLATICLVALYLAVLGNYTALLGVAISGCICAICALLYRSLRRT